MSLFEQAYAYVDDVTVTGCTLEQYEENRNKLHEAACCHNLTVRE